MRGLAYIVIEDDDITDGARPLNYTFTFGPARYTRKWRGKRFNIRGSRIIGVEAIC
jgi:hypothetical protein